MNSELKFKTILINKLKLLPTLYREATLTFLRFASKHYLTPSLRRFLFVSYTQLYVAYSKLCRGKLCKRKANHTLCLEAFDRHVFDPSQNRWSLFYYVMRMISTQIPWQDPWWSLRQVVRTSFGFHLRECMGSSLPPPLLATSIGHFWVAPSLCFKARLSVRPLTWKWFLILMQIKLVFTRKVFA